MGIKDETTEKHIGGEQHMVSMVDPTEEGDERTC